MTWEEFIKESPVIAINDKGIQQIQLKRGLNVIFYNCGEVVISDGNYFSTTIATNRTIQQMHELRKNLI